MTGQLGAEINLLDRQIYTDGSYLDRFRWLRDNDPVSWHEHPNGRGFWNIVRYDDVSFAARSPEIFSSETGGVLLVGHDEGGWEGLPDPRGKQLIMMDPPRHAKYRKVLSTEFTPRAVSKMEAALRARATRLVDAAIGREQCDFLEDIATEVPLSVIADMMGVPASDRSQLITWVLGIMASEPAAMESFLEYAESLARERMSVPGQDLVSQLVRAEVGGTGLSLEEVKLFLFLLTGAATEAPRSAISLGMATLLEHPASWAALQRDRTLLPRAVDEILRWTTPTMMFRRTATHNIELSGQLIAKGDKVVIWFASANRDERVFLRPDEFDISRHPNRHLTFGIGPHHCLGAGLARLELTTVLDALLDKVDRIELTEPVVTWVNEVFVRSVVSMPVIIRPRDQ